MELGRTLCIQGSLAQSVQHLRRAISGQPGVAAAHYHLGYALCEQGHVAESIECFRRAAALKPGYSDALMNRAFAMNYDPDSGPGDLYQAHRNWGALFPPVETLQKAHTKNRNPKKRLRVGYVSGDFCDHAVNYYFEPLLAGHNYDDFEIFCYSSLPKAAEDEITARLRGYPVRWTSICRASDQAAAARISADRIDILIDLGGYTARSRLTVFAHKPAPVQITWLGYCNTSGLAAMDYRITDAIVDPEGTEVYNREALFRVRPPYLCYRPFPDAPPVSAPPALASGHITFGSFNNLPKLTPAVIQLWAALLHAVPGSRLVIKAVQMRDVPTAKALRDQFARHGIAADRIDLLAWRVWTVHHLARYGLIDIALDPFPYTGVTTSCEAMWMGVPVVTLRGDRPAARVGASFLHAVGLDDLVTDDAESYLRTAASLAQNPNRLTELRFQLRERMRTSALCDEAGFARAMEQAYRQMWRAWCSSNTGRSSPIPSPALREGGGRG